MISFSVLHGLICGAQQMSEMPQIMLRTSWNWSDIEVSALQAIWSLDISKKNCFMYNMRFF